MALNGSGLAVAVGSSNFVIGGFRALDVFNATDPTNTGNLITRINLPEVPKDLALAGGLAFVADGAGGLLVVNYLGFDTQGVPPTVRVALDAVDADPATPGVQVLEGRTVRVVQTIGDDVQVRSVELLVNGQVVSTDVSYPFELFAQAPVIAASGTQMTVQVRATDTGGNVTLSDTLSIDVVRDTVPPRLLTASIDEGARLHFVKSIGLSFDESLDLRQLTPAAISLVRAGADGVFGTPDDVTIPVTINSRAVGQQISALTESFLAPGDYELRVNAANIVDVAGNVLATPIVRHFTVLPAVDVRAASGAPALSTAPSANSGQQIGMTVPFDPSTARASFDVADASGNFSTLVVNVFRTDAARSIAYFIVPPNAVTGDAVVFSQVGTVITNFPDGTMPLQIVPTVTDVQVQSVSSDGTTAVVVMTGTGFVEGANSEYHFGTGTIVDPGTAGGPDVANGTVRLTLPLSNGVFGAISVKTAGGTSAGFSVDLASVNATALSGTAADPTKASANAGQTITLAGTGLSTATDVLLRFTDNVGALHMVQLSPTAAAANGSSATLVLPAFVNGAFTLQVFGSASQPLLQIVPTLTSADIQSSTTLFGSGFVEGNTTYNFAGTNVSDTATDTGNNIDVASDSVDQNRRVNINRTALPAHGLGNVTVSTAGGASAPFALNAVRVNVNVASPSLGDVAVDPASGTLWVSDQSSPGHLLRIDAATGQVLQTITMTAGFGSTQLANNAGLQVLSAPMTLGATNVPAGSLLVFNGNTGGNDRVLAVNPVTTGTVIASLTLDAHYGLTGATFNPANDHIYLAEGGGAGNRIVELSATTGAQLGAVTAPFSVQTAAGLAIDPGTGHLWLGAVSGGAQLVQYRIEGTGVLTVLRSLDPTSQNINQNEISGLSFALDGTLWVASTQGEVYRISIGGPTP